MLFMDARKLGNMADRTHRDLSAEDIASIADSYHAWRTDTGDYATFPASARPPRWRKSAGTATSSLLDGMSARLRRKTTASPSRKRWSG